MPEYEHDIKRNYRWFLGISQYRSCDPLLALRPAALTGRLQKRDGGPVLSSPLPGSSLNCSQKHLTETEEAGEAAR